MTRLSPHLLRLRGEMLTAIKLAAGAHAAEGLDEDATELWRIHDEAAAIMLTTPQRVSQTRRTPALTVIEGGE
jgi:hypothetical protein